MMNYPPIDVWRMSASRPWQLEKTTDILHDKLKYSGQLRFHLIESVLVEEYSEQCISYMKQKGYTIHAINPAKGQGYAVDFALKNVIAAPFALKWEDDFMPEMDIPLDDCVDVMLQYPNVNQICFNKRETMKEKLYSGPGGHKIGWPKEQRTFKLSDGRGIPLVVKEKWWFGTALWRTAFIKSIFRYWVSNTHNLFNDEVILPMAARDSVSTWRNHAGAVVPSVEDIEQKIGCYIYGKTGDKRMVFHAGLGDSIWAGEYQKRIREEGKTLIGV